MNAGRLSEPILVLLRQYPREAWGQHPNLGMLARFWLDRHVMFRQLAAALDEGASDLREGRSSVRAFPAWFAPRLNLFLSGLQGHHLIEDRHYFPVFRAAEPRLEPGFALLDGDHERLHGRLIETAERARGLLDALAGADPDRGRTAAEHYADGSAALIADLLRHLDDEEDLIIPLILDRGEAALGVG